MSGGLFPALLINLAPEYGCSSLHSLIEVLPNKCLGNLHYMTPSPLPAELIDAILIHLPTDHSALRVCSQLSRAWLPWTRIRLFYRIRIDRENLVPFLRLLQSPLCTFALCLKGIDFHNFISEYPSPQSYHIILLDVINGPHPWIDHVHDGSLISNFRAHTQRKKCHIFHILNLFPTLEHITLPLHEFRFKMVQRVNLPVISPKIRSLILRCHGATFREWKTFGEWLQHNKGFSLSILYIEGISSSDLVGIESLLAGHSSLKHIHIKLSGYGAYTIYSFPLELQ